MATLSAALLPLMVLVFAVVANQVSAYSDKLRLQGAIDLAALQLVEAGHGDEDDAMGIAVLQGVVAEDVALAVVWGHYREDAGVPVAARFEAGGLPRNSVQINARLDFRERVLAGILSNDNAFQLTATAAVRRTATVQIGSRLLRLEGGLSAALLNALVGYDGRITAVDYEQMLAADVDVFTMLDALRFETDTTVATYDDLLDVPFRLGSVIDAADGASNARRSLLDLPEIGGTLSERVKLSGLLALGEAGRIGLDDLTGRPELTASLGEFVLASAALANGDNQLALGAEAGLGGLGLAGLDLTMGELPQLGFWDFSDIGVPGISTDQVRLDLSFLRLGGLPSGAEARIALASAEVSEVLVQCSEARTVERVGVSVVTSPAGASLRALGLGPIDLDLSSGEPFTVSFSPADISERTLKTGRSGLGVNVNRTSFLLRPLVRAVDQTLEATGLHLAEADVRVLRATCSRPYLVD